MDDWKINEAGDVELKLDDKHTLLIHRADEGVVLDVWTEGAEECVWSNYFFDSEMLPEE
jgi:hypothetical protein